jgi:inositol phosphorylceramide mannosyltransferase catalytic subunit
VGEARPPGRPTLSVCTLTGDPGPRVAAALALLRPVADEIVVAADSRADKQTLAAYASVADRVIRLEVDYHDRHQAWLHAQCSCDWILRVDGDEVMAPGLVEALPELIADRRVLQYLFPRRWLYPDAGHWLAELPWRPDYQLRLVRNDGLMHFSGRHHSAALPLRPARYLDTPIYHVDLLVKDQRARREKAAAYGGLLDPLEAPGGGEINRAFYVPEDRPGAVTLPVPAEDAAAIEAVMGAQPRERAPVPELPVVPLSDSDRHLPWRTFDESAYAAEAALAEGPVRMRPGERRAVHVRFVNRGTENWPWNPEHGPNVRATYRVRNDRGTVVVSDGPRTPFPCDVAPGEFSVVPLDTVAPVVPGSYRLEPDVVHEGVRWFGSKASIELLVATPQGWEKALPRRPRRRSLRLRRPRIPHLIHRIWLGGGELPEEALIWGETWRQHHPGWEMRMWGDEDVRKLVPPESLARCRSASEASNLARYSILARFGGVYIDTDVECRRPIDPLLDGVGAFAAWETEHRLGTAVLGAAPGQPLFEDLAEFSLLTSTMSIDNVESTGPGLLTLLAADHPAVTRFDRELFYPYRWDEREHRDEAFPDAYAVHHWSLSWANGS